MSKGKKRLFVLSLMLAAISSCSSSAPVYYSSCPLYPVGGAKVGAELEKISFEQAPALWEWLGRIDKLRQELEVCR